MVRFQADADLNQIIVAALVRMNPLVDFRAASVASRSGLSDAQVLELAAAEGRVLLTHDAKTMPRHFGDFVLSQERGGHRGTAAPVGGDGRRRVAPDRLRDLAAGLDEPHLLSAAVVGQ